MKLKNHGSTDLSKKAQRLLASMAGEDAPRTHAGPHIAAPRRIVTSGPYDGRELAPATGIAPARMAAYSLPSRIGNQLYWPDGRVTDLNSKGPAA